MRHGMQSPRRLRKAAGGLERHGIADVLDVTVMCDTAPTANECAVNVIAPLRKTFTEDLRAG